MYSCYGIVFEGRAFFGNESARNVLILEIDNSSTSHTYNRKNNFLVLVQEDILVLMEALVHQKKVK